MRSWVDGATVIEAVKDGGSMVGSDDYATWHSTENDPYTTRASSIAQYLNRTTNVVHIVWNPVTGERVVMLPKDRAGRGLENPAGGVETNRQGRVNIQIEVVARASHPFTQYPMKGLQDIMEAIDAAGVPRTWPSGRPLPVSRAYGPNPSRSVSKWNGKGGHFSHSQVPENHHADPGAIDTKALFSGKPAPAHGGGRVKPPANHEPNFNREDGDGLYEPGEVGPGIATVQRQLKAAGFDPGATDGFYGPDTTKAVKAFQRARHLDADGICGPKTLHALGHGHVAPHGPGLKVDGAMGSRTMRALQRAAGLRGKDVDGWFDQTGPYSYNFGKQTTGALRHHLRLDHNDNLVKAIQRKVGAHPDGALGHNTIVKLQRALNAGKF